MAIVLRGVNHNMMQIRELNQHVCNPQQQVRSVGTDESWIPSTFHFVESNDQHVPMAPGFFDRVWEGDKQAHNQGEVA